MATEKDGARDTGQEGDKGHGPTTHVGRPAPQKDLDNSTPREADPSTTHVKRAD